MIPPLAEQRFFEFTETFGKGKKIPVCARTGRKLIADGEIAIVRVSGRVLIPSESLEEFLRARFVPAKVQAPPVRAITSDEIIARARLGRPRFVKGETHG